MTRGNNAWNALGGVLAPGAWTHYKQLHIGLLFILCRWDSRPGQGAPQQSWELATGWFRSMEEQGWWETKQSGIGWQAGHCQASPVLATLVQGPWFLPPLPTLLGVIWCFHEGGRQRRCPGALSWRLPLRISALEFELRKEDPCSSCDHPGTSFLVLPWKAGALSLLGGASREPVRLSIRDVNNGQWSTPGFLKIPNFYSALKNIFFSISKVWGFLDFCCWVRSEEIQMKEPGDSRGN